PGPVGIGPVPPTAPPANEAPAGAPGGSGMLRPSGLNLNLKSKSPFRSVVSKTGRPTCCDSIPKRFASGTPVAWSIMPVGLIITNIAPLGKLTLGEKVAPAAPGGGG